MRLVYCGPEKWSDVEQYKSYWEEVQTPEQCLCHILEIQYDIMIIFSALTIINYDCLMFTPHAYYISKSTTWLT
jgi:hypothetical protein